MLDMPYFMTNEEWYYFDFNSKKYKLTKNATEKAIKSYNEFYSTLNKTYS